MQERKYFLHKMNSFSHYIPLLINIGTLPDQNALNNTTSIPLNRNNLVVVSNTTFYSTPPFKRKFLGMSLPWSTIAPRIIAKSEMERNVVVIARDVGSN